MQITLEQLQKSARKKINVANAMSVLIALEKYGHRFGLDQPHRLAQFLAQIMHESGEFRYDKEIASGAAYEGRKALGNTQPGDGVKFKGRTAIQITGRANTKAFRDWCRKFDKKCPDFLTTPDLMNTDPWEGLGPIWYWDSRGLNQLADQGDVENITEKINGGLNGYADRVTLLGRISLVLLGYGPTEVKRFQKEHGVELIDGKPGPKTRSAMHVALVALTKGAMDKPTVTSSPVTEVIVEEKPIAVTPPELDKPVTQTGGFRERITTLLGLLGTGVASLMGDWRVVLALVAGLIVIVIFGLLLHTRIVNAVKNIKEAVEQ